MVGFGFLYRVRFLKRIVSLVFWDGFVLLGVFFFLGIFVYSFVLVILCLMFRSMLRMD